MIFYSHHIVDRYFSCYQLWSDLFLGYDLRIEDVDQNIGENYPSHDCEEGTAKNAASMGQEHDSVCNPLQGNNNLDSCTSEDNCTTLVHHQDSESSTTPSRNP
ncbi:hypothetical protein RHGRI_034513 [Rhododendron griersonianum]|uniref:Uncharacterized protein n=1 Tax=Rhododendron griersonianum TaxID=479676 RepID=A0AAV6I3N2_9ERIC|nr:hypothetical protein RHGRI_034513 [Rhododendron griersonianum]